MTTDSKKVACERMSDDWRCAHLHAVQQAHALVRDCMNALRHDMQAMARGEDRTEYATRLWGEKDNAVAVLTKLCALQKSLGEQESMWRMAQMDQAQAGHHGEALPPLQAADWQLLERAVALRNAEKDNGKTV